VFWEVLELVRLQIQLLCWDHGSKYRRVSSMVIVGKGTSDAGFWVGCQWCHLASVLKSDTQLVHLVGELLELSL